MTRDERAGEETLDEGEVERQRQREISKGACGKCQVDANVRILKAKALEYFLFVLQQLASLHFVKCQLDSDKAQIDLEALNVARASISRDRISRLAEKLATSDADLASLSEKPSTVDLSVKIEEMRQTLRAVEEASNERAKRAEEQRLQLENLKAAAARLHACLS